ncbi:probable ubiquitin carboxyl-terminal hydrolase MINDY-4 isoform X2 [Gouania willdenowi]|uniref:probable ubiquitin carboxyl-terminal hydrolase MINDY-4 isoform X2 n=1 Tax=Gouania willdenowi TaxID=441366 RepID=UPI0010560A8C|nr:probable ubiquitin carboxyl-terminal hydrolase MINDY-4 isoform X2 [Gouania willdenowi]XP_028301348.1 probable ubiquitin carboxyl-terminal hydrolase MINDY-4 isoform X2 [Gouania willdenowi]
MDTQGLKRTIACMDEEHPRSEASINNRSLLRQLLGIEDLYRNNKVQKCPLKTLLEIIVNHHMERLKCEKITSNEVDSSQKASSDSTPTHNKVESFDVFDNSKETKLRTSLQSLPTCDATNTPQLASSQDNLGNSVKEPEKSSSIPETMQQSRNNRIRRGMMAGPIPQESNRKRQSRKVEVSQSVLRKEEETQVGLLMPGSHQKSQESSLAEICSADYSIPERIHSEDSFEKRRPNIPKTREVKLKPKIDDLNSSEMVLDDIDDDDNDDGSDLPKGFLQKTTLEHNYAAHPVDRRTAMELKVVLLGSGLNNFNIEWRSQGFTFSETHDLRYGIVQKKGGPCGVLASVQACLLKNLLFENTESCNTGLQRIRPSNSMRRKCLILALAEILWKAGEEKQAMVAIHSGNDRFTSAGHYKSDEVLEKVMCVSVNDIKDLQLLLEHYIDRFQTGMLGCFLLTISAVLSRSIEKVKEDMDVPTTALIGNHGYCTQELVNLLLCGRAVSNVFDNDVELDSGNGNMTLLKGIKSRCDVGFLSLFEHYNICKVGAYLKSPCYPIWVVCSESHFSVLFGLQRELLTCEDKCHEFDLYYYDGLANQQEEIRLTVSVGTSTSSCQNPDSDLIPPLELCIRTRWNDALVCWNDTEPIL